ncbi:MAG TPA: hypothetical protein DEO32_01165 [Ruminococcaceae bacterium]|nr:hypothetical protein [Oscillospiraceae bacterium]
MKNYKFALCAVLSILIAAAAFTGCNNNDKSSATETNPVSTEKATVQPATSAPATKPSTDDSASEKQRKYNFLAIKQKSDAIYSSLDDIISDNNFSGSVYLKLGNDLEFNKCSGSSDEVQRKKNSLHTNFYTGSLTKHITAAAVLKLSEEKKLSLDDNLGKYFPDCSYAKDVTIKNLLTMTSAVPSYTKVANGKLQLVDELDKKIKEDYSEKKNKSAVLNWILSQKLNDRAGKKYKYSDSGYFLLGEIIEKASGTSYTAYVSENILKPLGMNNSGFKAPSSLATAYDDKNESVNKLTLGGVGYSALGFISNVSDTIRYIEGIFDENVINSNSLLAMHTPFLNGYGYGVKIDGDRIEISSNLGAYSATVTYSTDETELYVAYSNYASSDAHALNVLFKDYLKEFLI